MIEALGHYRILDRIGSGGIGDVFRARDTRLGRTTAIKVVRRDIAADPERRRQLLLDAEAATALSHPNIAALYEIGEDRDRLYLVFEFVPGEPLARLIAGQALHPRRAVDFAAQIADALAEIHAHSIVHRDLRPANIVITPKDKAKILEAGLAAWTEGGALRPGAEVPPTVLAYRSPEHVRGDPVDHRTDIFSAGAVLFEMLTGRLPFERMTAGALQMPIGAPPPPSSITSTVPRQLDRIVARALERNPDARYDSAAILAAELRQVAALLEERSSGSGTSGGYGRSAGSHRSVGSNGSEGSGGLQMRWVIFCAALAVIAAAGWCTLVR
jgi:eukaryotic-like serine/threonine-protein kinase